MFELIFKLNLAVISKLKDHKNSFKSEATETGQTM